MKEVVIKISNAEYESSVRKNRAKIKFTGRVNYYDQYQRFVYKYETYLNGKLHCTDGAAVVYFDYEERNIIAGVSYYLLGKEYSSKEEWFNNLTSEQKVAALFNQEFYLDMEF